MDVFQDKLAILVPEWESEHNVAWEKPSIWGTSQTENAKNVTYFPLVFK